MTWHNDQISKIQKKYISWRRRKLMSQDIDNMVKLPLSGDQCNEETELITYIPYKSYGHIMPNKVECAEMEIIPRT